MITNTINYIKDSITTIKQVIIEIANIFSIIGDILGFIGFKVFLLLITTAFVLWALNLVSPLNKKFNYFLAILAGITLGIKAKMPFNSVILKYILLIFAPFLINYTINLFVIFLKNLFKHDYLKILYTIDIIIQKFHSIIFLKIKKFFPIKKGSIIDIIFISKIPNYQDLNKIKEFIKILGYKPRIKGEELFSITNNNNEYLLNQNEQIQEIISAIKSKDSKVVWCWDDNENFNEVLYSLSKETKIFQNKIIVGSNSIFLLHNFLFQEWGWLGYNNFSLKTAMIKNISLDLFNQKNIKLIYNLRFIKKVENFKTIYSTIVGGEFNSIILNIGTKHQINSKDKILLINIINDQIDKNKFLHLANYIIDNREIPKCILFFYNTFNIDNEKLNEIFSTFIEKLEENKIKIPILKNGDELEIFNCFIGLRTKIEYTDNKITLIQKFGK